ncbi:hypothetical protein HRG_002321 [Hirsutella rhossiliensis]|uniref:Uncharacterized protein n=1 Tax=Hirsutella rhossiliensis TaxID=111463 RepID=A0A9P8N958_9HYPO|nr:uncharacterized protein HRG_02321 [Hirsutella rhossiliensis]KAH0966912.1 hypothetical protein HRG_02321 [Hirsutella rhossiliensis]
MLLTQFVGAALLTLGSVNALPQANPDAGIQIRAVDDVEGHLAARADAIEARHRGCPKHYYQHNGQCCRFRHIRREYYDCHPW